MPGAANPRSRRIAVVLGGEADAGVVSVVGSLVSATASDVAGVFVEDHALFRTAELPFATEVCRVTTVRRPLTRSELERQMRVLALRAERALRSVAERAGSPWSFRRHRGALSTALADAAEVDFVVIGTTRRTLVPAGELHATARAFRSVEAEARRPVVLMFDASESGGRALDASVELAERTGRRLVVFVPASTTELPPEVALRLQSLGPVRASIRALPSAEPADLRAAVRRTVPAVVVVGADEAGFAEDRVGELHRDVTCPLVVVR